MSDLEGDSPWLKMLLLGGGLLAFNIMKFIFSFGHSSLGFWGFILRGLVLTALVGVGGYLLPIAAEYVHKLPPL